ncbi:Protein of unknown function [Gryllus bimaculatus]|nr:Protein of unknown function [Gryllus bimaculatus]
MGDEEDKRLRQRGAEDRVGQDDDDPVRHHRHAAVPALPVQHRRHPGQELQVDLRALLQVQGLRVRPATARAAAPAAPAGAAPAAGAAARRAKAFCFAYLLRISALHGITYHNGMRA